MAENENLKKIYLWKKIWNFLTLILKESTDFLEMNILSFLSCLLVIYLGFHIPQIRTIFLQSTLNGVEKWDIVLVILFRISILSLLFVYMLFIYLIKRQKEEFKNFSFVAEKVLERQPVIILIGIITFVFSFLKFEIGNIAIHTLFFHISSAIILLYFWSISSRLRHKLDEILSKYHLWLSGEKIEEIDKSHRPKFPLLLGAGLLGVGLLWLIIPFIIGNKHILNIFPALIFWYGFWMMWIPFLKDSESKNVHQMIGRTLMIVIICLLFSTCLWKFANMESIVSYRNYSTWAIIHIFFLIIAVARIFDAFPKKFFFLIIAFLVFFSFKNYVYEAIPIGKETKKVQEGEVFSKKQLDITLYWLNTFHERIKKSNQADPLIIVAASSGGGRGSLFASLVYEHLIKKKKDKNILLVSGVSGGALASAYHYVRKDIKDNKAQYSFLKPKLKNSMYSEIKHYILENAKNEDQTKRRKIAEKIDEYLRNPHCDAMCTDFFAPLFRGMLYLISLERGQSVAKFWERKFKWEKIYNFQPDGNSQRNVNRPLMILNSTILAEGKTLAIGFPQLLVDPTKFMDKEGISDLEEKIEEHGSVESLSDNCPYYQMPLSHAVQASSAFPYVFEVVYILRKDKKAYLIDGAFADKTGFISLIHVLLRIKHFASLDEKYIKDTLGSKNKEKLISIIEKAKKIIEAIRYQGLLLVEIDSELRPETEKITQLLHGYPMKRPIIALDTCAYKRTKLAKERFKKDIKNFITQENKEFEALFGNTKYSLEGDIMMTWTLGPKEKSKVFFCFLKKILGKGEACPNLDLKIEKIKNTTRKLGKKRDKLLKTLQKKLAKTSPGRLRESARFFYRFNPKKQKKLEEIVSKLKRLNEKYGSKQTLAVFKKIYGSELKLKELEDLLGLISKIEANKKRFTAK